MAVTGCVGLIVRSDIDGDNRISAVDAIYVINRIGNDPTVGDNAAADVNNDGSIDEADATQVIEQIGATLD